MKENKMINPTYGSTHLVFKILENKPKDTMKEKVKVPLAMILGSSFGVKSVFEKNTCLTKYQKHF